MSHVVNLASENAIMAQHWSIIATTAISERDRLSNSHVGNVKCVHEHTDDGEVRCARRLASLRTTRVTPDCPVSACPGVLSNQ
jgi:hypothetical protein